MWINSNFATRKNANCRPNNNPRTTNLLPPYTYFFKLNKMKKVELHIA